MKLNRIDGIDTRIARYLSVQILSFGKSLTILSLARVQASRKQTPIQIQLETDSWKCLKVITLAIVLLQAGYFQESTDVGVDEADDVMYTEMHYSLSVCLINMSNGNTLPPFDQVRRMVMAHSNMACDENSPSSTLSLAEMRDQTVASEVHAVERRNGDGSLSHVSYTLVDELMANSDAIDAVGPEPMDVDQQGPMFGPPTHEDAMIEDIHERRARVLEELNDRLQDAYNHGPEELVWSLQAQIDWWHSVI